MLLQNNYRCVFPNLLHGKDARFEETTYLDTRGDKHRTVRGAWQPFFFSGRCAAALYLGGCLHCLRKAHRTSGIKTLHVACGHMVADMVMHMS